MVLPPLKHIRGLPDRDFLTIGIRKIYIVRSRRAASALAGGASAGGQEGFVASGEVEDGTGELDLACQFGVGGQKLLGTGAGVGDHVGILDHAQELQAGLAAGLGVAEYIAGTAEFQVGLGDFGTVERVVNHFEPLLGRGAGFLSLIHI